MAIDPREAIAALVGGGFSPATGVPCSVFKDLLGAMATSAAMPYHAATSEGEAMGIAGGFALAGKTPVVIMQVDGAANALNPLTSLQLLYKLPCLLLISWRGEPGRADAPQHRLMGAALTRLLTLFEIPFAVPEADQAGLSAAIRQAAAHIAQAQTPFAIVIRKKFFSPCRPQPSPDRPPGDTRSVYLSILSRLCGQQYRFIGTTGFGGREMHQRLSDRNRFYMMGAMGCALSIGLGLALSRPRRPVVVLDGDGALMMKLGTLATVGANAPKNLFHLCFDNGQYESTGGQPCVSTGADLSEIAKACGYATAADVSAATDFEKRFMEIAALPGPHFLRIRIRPGADDDLPRPVETPEEMKRQFMTPLPGAPSESETDNHDNGN